jgi:hypothetical protein
MAVCAPEIGDGLPALCETPEKVRVWDIAEKGCHAADVPSQNRVGSMRRETSAMLRAACWK